MNSDALTFAKMYDELINTTHDETTFAKMYNESLAQVIKTIQFLIEKSKAIDLRVKILEQEYYLNLCILYK